ncbi:MAG: phosphate signaling complex protein PhoU [Thermodesulfobacteriota bacterium]|jgi:phosphate transport system protein|nr:phosphate signaling complex protein PhoU [Candidatus Dadabacteria bacterium]MCZ6469058.1 phosphate signaling complex protein PhoU [Candidatus Dadabacteria bacterium]MCZ6555775.1 phosphate signaling complex protein PhoU [Candidatus Dadabacteria bacterium]MCZ6790268.1 phosphate signaling complex protein PhoU [Candidatus Dadabacteria bacterium]MCZ6864833.1 phosphate signaling complex protein PhoU [Candidatus Dadabacteria bacterium]
MIRLEEEINKLKKMLFEMASSAEEMIAKSIKALQENNMILAEEIIKSDDKVNEMEIEIDNQCIRILALFHPEAEDLRTVTMIMKINNDLERIGDHAVNIAEKVIYLADKPPVKPLIDIPKMAEKAIEMLQESLDSFVNKDAELAIQVCKKDDEVDALEPQIVRELITYMISDPQTIDRALTLIFIARALERVADLATNIAEDTYYIASGKILKHHSLRENK